jgi:Fe-S-cluster-containing dehydrogenase component
MKKWALVFDVDKCTNCANCALAVQDEYVGNSFPGYAAEMPLHGHRWIEIKRRERGSHPMLDVAYVVSTCQHCDAAPCMAAAKDGAVVKRDDGIVVIDPDKAKGQKQLVDACPYGAIWWNDALGIPQHWNFDAHLIDAGWTKPRPVQSCPTGALTAHKLDDRELARLAVSEGLEPLEPELGTKPRLLYKNLHRYRHGFVGGALVETRDGVEDCVAGAEVSLRRDGRTVATVRSDAFGDFKIDDIPEDGTDYELEVSIDGDVRHRRAVTMTETVYLGDVDLSRGEAGR